MHWLDPDYLPEVSGTFERFLINPRGDADGMLLGDGTEIHFPPHMSAELRTAIPVGEKPDIKVRGVRLRGSDLIAAVAIEPVNGKRIVDNGPPKKHDRDEGKPGMYAVKPRPDPMHTEGTIQRVLHGPKGEVRGALLEDDTIIRIPPHDARRIAHLLSPGRRLAVRGGGLTSALGTVIEAREVGPSADELQPLKPKRPIHEKPSDQQADTHAM